jgi:hypothetical protein
MLGPVSRLTDDLMCVGLPIPGTAFVPMLDGTQLDMSTGQLVRPEEPEERPHQVLAHLIPSGMRPPFHASPMERWYWSYDVLQGIYRSESEDDIPASVHRAAS